MKRLRDWNGFRVVQVPETHTMNREFHDRCGKAMTKQQVQTLPAEQLAERSGVAVHILADVDSIYDAIAEVMIEVIEAKQGGKVTMILPVGPIGQYPAFARKVAQRNIDCRHLITFNMD